MANDLSHSRITPLPPALPQGGETCDYCGSPELVWRKCKLICGSCGQIVKSCADL